MHRQAQQVFARQIPLDLEPTPAATAELALRDAYERLQLSRNHSFEQVMSAPAYAIGIRNLAEAIARRADPAQAAPRGNLSIDD